MSFRNQGRSPGDLMINLLEKLKYEGAEDFKSVNDLFAVANDPRMQRFLTKGDVEGDRKKLAQKYQQQLKLAQDFLKEKTLNEREKSGYEAAVRQIEEQISQCLNAKSKNHKV